MIIFVLLTFWWNDSKINPYRDDNYFSNEKRPERITGVNFKIKKVIEFEKETQSFMDDYSAKTKILLKEQPDCRVLDSLVRKIYGQNLKTVIISTEYGEMRLRHLKVKRMMMTSS